MKFHPPSSRPSFNGQAGRFGILLLNTSYKGKSVTLWTDRIDHIEANEHHTIVTFRTSSNPSAPQRKEHFSVNYDAFMLAYLAADQRKFCADLRPICNLSMDDRYSNYNGNNETPPAVIQNLIKMINTSVIFKQSVPSPKPKL